MNVIYLTKNYGMAWQLMPEAMNRVTAFCEKYETDGSAEYLCGKLVTSFASDCPSVMCFLLAENDKIVGHVLCGLDDWCGKKFITILQYETDGPGSPETIATALHELEKWARAIGAHEWQAIVRNETLARVFRRFYGFQDAGRLVRKAFSPSADTSPGVAVTASPKLEQGVPT